MKAEVNPALVSAMVAAGGQDVPTAGANDSELFGGEGTSEPANGNAEVFTDPAPAELSDEEAIEQFLENRPGAFDAMAKMYPRFAGGEKPDASDDKIFAAFERWQKQNGVSVVPETSPAPTPAAPTASEPPPVPVVSIAPTMNPAAPAVDLPVFAPVPPPPAPTANTTNPGYGDYNTVGIQQPTAPAPVISVSTPVRPVDYSPAPPLVQATGGDAGVTLQPGTPSAFNNPDGTAPLVYPDGQADPQAIVSAVADLQRRVFALEHRVTGR